MGNPNSLDFKDFGTSPTSDITHHFLRARAMLFDGKNARRVVSKWVCHGRCLLILIPKGNNQGDISSRPAPTTEMCSSHLQELSTHLQKCNSAGITTTSSGGNKNPQGRRLRGGATPGATAGLSSRAVTRALESSRQD